MWQITALIHDTYWPDWRDGSCENGNWKIIDYNFLSCGPSHILLALCQECPYAGLPLSLLLHLCSGFYVDLSKNYPSLSQPDHGVSVSKIANRCSSIFSVLISQPLFFYVVAVPKFNLNQMPQLFASLCWS